MLMLINPNRSTVLLALLGTLRGRSSVLVFTELVSPSFQFRSNVVLFHRALPGKEFADPCEVRTLNLFVVRAFI